MDWTRTGRNIQSDLFQTQLWNVLNASNYLNEIVWQVRQERDASFKEDQPTGSSSKARRADPADGGILQGVPGFRFVYFHPPAIQEEVKTKLEEHEKFQTTMEEGIQELKSKGEAR